MGDKPISFKDKNGNFVSAADVWNAEKLEEQFEDVEVEIHQGDQPVYPYLFSVE